VNSFKRKRQKEECLFSKTPTKNDNINPVSPPESNALFIKKKLQNAMSFAFLMFFFKGHRVSGAR
jgi:hypothetical protein